MKIRLLLALTAIAVLWCGCYNDEYDDSSREIRASASAANVIVSQSTRQAITGDTFSGQDALVLATEVANDYSDLRCNGTMKFDGSSAARYGTTVPGSDKYFPAPDPTVYLSGLYPASGWSCDNSLEISGTNATVTYTVDGKTDIMYAPEKSATLNQTPPMLTFDHLLTLLKIQLEKVGSTTITVNSITLVGAVEAEVVDNVVVPSPLHTQCNVALNKEEGTPQVTFSLDETEPVITEIDCFKMVDGNYTDNEFTGQTLTQTPALPAYVLAPALKSTEVGTNADYTFRVVFQIGTGEPITAVVPVNLTTDNPEVNYDSDTAGYSFLITLIFTGGDVAATAEIDPWDNGGGAVDVVLPPTPPLVFKDGGTNCFMVEPGATLSFDVTRAYVHNELGEITTTLHVGGTYEGAFEAEVLWEDPDVIDGDPIVEGDGIGAYVELVTNSLSGNAVVSIYKAGEADHTPVWSYHIWVTDYNPDAVGGSWTNPNQQAYTFMDRDLGATSSEISLAGVGLYYQWGRKDPFPNGPLGTAGYAARNSFKGLDYTIYVSHATDNAAGIAESIENPTTLYAEKDYGTHSWLPNHVFDLWATAAGMKNIYDPCPSGWRVPMNRDGIYDDKADNSAWIGFVNAAPIVHDNIVGFEWWIQDGTPLKLVVGEYIYSNIYQNHPVTAYWWNASCHYYELAVILPDAWIQPHATTLHSAVMDFAITRQADMQYPNRYFGGYNYFTNCSLQYGELSNEIVRDIGWMPWHGIVWGDDDLCKVRCVREL
jgi:hypothetical protein